MVNRAFDKVRQAGRGMPAVVIRLLDSLSHIIEYTSTPSQRTTLVRQADMILRGAERDLDEPEDLADVRRRYDALISRAQRMSNHPTVTIGDGAPT